MFNFQKRISLCMILSCLWGLSCTRSSVESNDPKGRLTGYISKSFSINKVEDKIQLMSYLTGDVKTRLEGWSEDQFKEAFIDAKREFVKLAFREIKEISAEEFQITYELTYMDQGRDRGGKSHPAKVTNKKLCQMVRKDGQWLIGDVRNIKEVLEYKNEMSLP